MNNRVYDLEERLINFGVLIIDIAESMNKSRYAGFHLSRQLIRSGTSAGIHYGEAQGAESRRDFVHKMKIILKELQETRGNLRMVKKAGLIESNNKIETVIIECNELVAIFVKSIQTARKTEKQKNRETDKQTK